VAAQLWDVAVAQYGYLVAQLRYLVAQLEDVAAQLVDLSAKLGMWLWKGCGAQLLTRQTVSFEVMSSNP